MMLPSISFVLVRARLCIEGIPSHVRQLESISTLFKNPVIIDELHCDKEKPEEEYCVCLWVWMSDPDRFSQTGTLEVAEPVILPEDGYGDFLQGLGVPSSALKQCAAELLRFNVIIHLDRVLDYSTPPSSPLPRSYHSDTSGLPDDDVDSDWPIRHPFVWRLGVPNGGDDERRVRVHDRLGSRVRTTRRQEVVVVAPEVFLVVCGSGRRPGRMIFLT
jgi:hypothetical protein